MLLQDILNFFEQKAPLCTAEEWDSVGLLVDCGHENIDAVAVALDATPDAIRFAQAQGAQLLITHHPIIFAPLRVLSANHPAAVALSCGVSVLCLHTNLDKATGGVNDTLAALLGLQEVTVTPDGLCRVGTIAPISTEQFAALCAQKLGTTVAVCGDNLIGRVAVCGGSGGDYIPDLAGSVDAFVTGEVKHHEFLAAQDSGLTVIAGGHFSTEYPVVNTLKTWLAAAFPDLKITTFETDAPYRFLR